MKPTNRHHTCAFIINIPVLFLLITLSISCQTKKATPPLDWQNSSWQNINDELSIAALEDKREKKVEIPESLSYKLVWMSKPKKDTIHATLTEVINDGLRDADSVIRLADNRPMRGFIKLSYRLVLEEDEKIRIIISNKGREKDPHDSTIAREKSWLRSLQGVTEVRFISKDTWLTEYLMNHKDADTSLYSRTNNPMPSGYDFMLNTRGLTVKKMNAFTTSVQTGFESRTSVLPSSVFSNVYTYVYEFTRK